MKTSFFDVRKKDDTVVLVREQEFEIEEAVNKAEKVYNFCKQFLHTDELAEEHSYVLCYSSDKMVGVFELSKGLVDTTLVRPRELLLRTLLCDANAFIIVHNHPSGITKPSNDDLQVTARLKQASEIMGVKMLDHVIVGNDSYYSFRKNNLL